jgi:hypothetical protein
MPYALRCRNFPSPTLSPTKSRQTGNAPLQAGNVMSLSSISRSDPDDTGPEDPNTPLAGEEFAS